ncbi:MAG TPA: OsmC family protein [Syntrophorhabdales bacterium]|nr:OsmC family protein [Syntrophorhabdales bacterium]
MMGTLAGRLAKKGITTPEESYWAEVEGDIENVNGVLKITQIRVDYHVTLEHDKEEEAREAFASYLAFCPAAQSVIGCIEIKDNLVLAGK